MPCLIVMALACAMAHAALSTPATAATNAEREARARDIRQAAERLDAELAAHGGSFEKWAESLKDYREDIARAKGPHMGGLQFQSQSIRIIRTDDLDAQPEGYRPFDAIVAFDRQLKERGIDLIVAIIPSKLCVYPDYLVVAINQAARAPADRQVAPCIKRLHKKLLEADVEVVDLYTAFQEARAKQADAVPYVYATDSHWKNAGARVAADAVAGRLKRYEFARQALARGNPFTFVAAAWDDGNKADPDLHLVRLTNGKPYWDAEDSPVILTGDSYSQYNQNVERPAHLSAQVALRIGVPLTLLAHSGLSYDMPTEMARLSQGTDYLRGRRVVVWTFNDKMIPMSGAKGRWSTARLPPSGATGPAAAGGSTPAPVPTPATPVTATVVSVSAPPPKDAPYPHCFLLAYVKDLKDATGKPIGAGDGVLRILALHRRKVLPAAAIKPGDRLAVKLTPWSAVEKTYGKCQRGSLPVPEVEIEKPHYLAELPGAPTMTADDVRRGGEE